MAPKKNQPSRLGSDPFGWIRDTREETDDEILETEEQEREPTPQPEPAPVPEPSPKAAPEPKAKATPTPRPKPAQATQAAPAQTVPAGQEEASQESVRSAIEEAKEALTVQEIKALAALLEEAKGPAKRGRPRTNFREVTKSSQEGLPENWTRATFIVRESHLETLKDYAYTQRMTIRDALDQALDQYLEDKQVIARRVRGEEEER